MISRIIEIRFEDKLKETEMYFNEKFYIKGKNESECFSCLIKDYFLELIRGINLEKYKLKFFNTDYKYFNKYSEGLELYIPTDTGYSQFQEILSAIGFQLKHISNKHCQIICKRKLILVESFMSPALYYSNIEESWFVISGSEINIKIIKQIDLFWDLLWIQIKPKYTAPPIDENRYLNLKNWEHAEHTTDEDIEEEKPDIRIKLFW